MMRRRGWMWRWIGPACAALVLPLSAVAQESAKPAPATPTTPPTAAPDSSAPEVERTYRTTCEFGLKDNTCEVRLTVSKAAATVADRIEVILEARVPEGIKVEWPEIKESLGGLNVLGVENQPSVTLGVGEPESAKRELVRRVVLLEPFLPGEREIPAMEVRFVGAGGAACKITTESVKIQINSLLSGEAKDPELRGIVEPKPVGTAWWVWAAGGGGVLVLASVAALALSRRRRRPEPPLTAYGTAMKRLEELEESGMLGEGKTSEYCTVLGETLRAFVGATMGLPEADRTTEQLMAELGSQPSVNISALGELLAGLDEASFAGAPIGVGEAQELRDKVHKMVVGMQAMRTAAETGSAPVAVTAGGER